MEAVSKLFGSEDLLRPCIVLRDGEPGELDDVGVIRPPRRQIPRTRSETIDLIASGVEWTDVGDKWKCDAICRSI
jgi:hypothetical protein